MRKWLQALIQYFRKSTFTRQLFKFFDWPLFIIVLGISLFSIVCIFSATTTSVTEKPATIMEMLATQPITYARLQFFWLMGGTVAMFAIMYLSYEVYGKYARTIFVVMLIVLVIVLGMEAGRGGMTAYFQWGSNRSIQPSEFGKIAIIVCLAKLLAVRKTPINNVRDLVVFGMHVAVPLILVLAQQGGGIFLTNLPDHKDNNEQQSDKEENCDGFLSFHELLRYRE